MCLEIHSMKHTNRFLNFNVLENNLPEDSIFFNISTYSYISRYQPLVFYVLCNGGVISQFKRNNSLLLFYGVDISKSIYYIARQCSILLLIWYTHKVINISTAITQKNYGGD